VSAGQIVGQALEGYSGSSNKKLLVRVNIAWYQPGVGVDTTAFLHSMTTATISANFASSDLLNLKNATMSSLMVLGRTTLNDLGVTGKINSGLLVVNGLDTLSNGTSAPTINTLVGDLYLQNEGYGGVNILNGKVTIDSTGNVNVNAILGAQTVETSNLIIKGTDSVGSATLPAGQTQVEIDTQSVSSTSKVLVTPTSLTSIPLAVTTKANGKFIVQISTSQKTDINFDWWVIGTK
jgi:hypothetical protein